MPKCKACGEEYADEKQHLIDHHNLDQPSLLTEIAYYTGLVCLFLAVFIFGNILMFAYLIIIQ
jgi:hypothetical protein